MNTNEGANGTVPMGPAGASSGTGTTGITSIASAGGTVLVTPGATGPAINLEVVPPVGSGTLVTATTTTLAAIASATLSEGTSCEVTSLKAVWDLLPSSVAARSYLNIAASGKAGFQWVRRIIRNPIWETTNNWVVDPQNGAASDDNTGQAGSPLSTLTELSRRLGGAVIAAGTLITATLASDCLNTDKPSWSFVVQPGSNGGDGLLILGTPGTPLYTGSVTGRVQQTQGNVPSADDNQMTDAAIPVSFTASGLLASGLLFQRTNGTALFWYALKDLGSKTIRMSDAVTATGAITLLAVNDTYTVSALPKIYDQSFSPRTQERLAGKITVQFCDWNGTATSGTGPIEATDVIFDRCGFQTAKPVTNAILLNCGFWAVVGSVLQGHTLFRGGAVIGAGAGSWSILMGGIAEFSSSGPTHFQGVVLSAAQCGVWTGTVFAFYDCTADCLSVSYGSVGAILGAFKGKGNTAKLMTALQSSSIVYNHAVSPPTVDASSSDIAPIKAGQTTTVSATLMGTTGVNTPAYAANIVPTP